VGLYAKNPVRVEASTKEYKKNESQQPNNKPNKSHNPDRVGNHSHFIKNPVRVKNILNE
jgi:hypothetical protein